MTDLFSRFIAPNERDGGLTVSCAHQGLGDIDTPSLLASIENALTQRSNSNSATADTGCPITLVAEMNFFGDESVSLFLARARVWASPNASLSQRGAYWVRLRLHMNRVGDAGCAEIASFIHDLKASPRAPAEVHLSHNRVTAVGALALVLASGRRYPRQVPGARAPIPFWLRLEHNLIDADAVRRGATKAGVRWCPGVSTGGVGGRGRGRGGRSRGRGGGNGGGSGGLRCGASLCLQNGAIAAKATAATRSGGGGGGGGKRGRGRGNKSGRVRGGGAIAVAITNEQIPFCHVHLCLLDEQRPASKYASLPLSSLLNATAAARVAPRPPPPIMLRALFAGAPTTPIATPLAVFSDVGIAIEGFTHDGELLDDNEEDEEEEEESNGDDEGVEEEDLELDVDNYDDNDADSNDSDKIEAVVMADASAVTSRTFPSVSPPTLSPSPVSPLYIILDTSAVVRLWDRAATSAFTFAHLGANGASRGAVWVLLDTVLQQLDDGKRGSPQMARAVNGFMRAYPALESAGALVRLAAEDVEDIVRSGGAHVATRPGCRNADGRFDSDGVIIDASLVVTRALVGTGAAAILLTADVGMRARARGARMPAALWEDVATNWTSILGDPPLSADAFLAALPKEDRLILLGGAAIAAKTVTNGSPPPIALVGLSAAFELGLAADVTTELAEAARALVFSDFAHCAGAVIRCPLCSRVSAAIIAAESGALKWRALLAERRGASSLHAAVFADRARDRSPSLLMHQIVSPPQLQQQEQQSTPLPLTTTTTTTTVKLDVAAFNFDSSSDEEEEEKEGEEEEEVKELAESVRLL
jgi:hypothetical protein